MSTKSELIMVRPHIDESLSQLTKDQLNSQKVFIQHVITKCPHNPLTEDQKRYIPYRKWLAFYYSRVLELLGESDEIVETYKPFKAMSAPPWIGDRSFHSRCRELLKLENQ